MDVKLFKCEFVLADAFIVIDQQPRTQQLGAFRSTQPHLVTLTLGTPHSKDMTDCQSP